jgi:pimeloyl-ACP methyl ester carboxylesterase
MLKDKIPSEDIRGFILKNLKRNQDNSFSWKLNARDLLNNLGNIMNSIDLNEAVALPVCGFPVVFMKGSLSNYIQAEDIASIRKIFPAAEFVVINGAGHWLHADKPLEVIRTLRNLLSQD